MSPQAPPIKFTQACNRILAYAHSTKIRWRKVPRLREWTAYGLPDLRGFTPHLRTVNVYAKANTSIKNLSEIDTLWVLHDLLHIMFYDFATLHLGEECWLDRARFIENHLASEAFAVLVLDYHLLPAARRENLASDFHWRDWDHFCKINSGLPKTTTSPKFAQSLTELYLTGNPGLIFNSAISCPRYASWIGHEIRYSRKQRSYVTAWYNDLMNLPHSFKEAIIDQTFAHEPINELIETLLYSSERTWLSFATTVNSSLAGEVNFFKHFPKYGEPLTQSNLIDFRFSDVECFPKRMLLSILNSVDKPSASHLFFLWQLLASVAPNTLQSSELEWVRRLADSSNTFKVDYSSWNKVVEIVRSTFKILRNDETRLPDVKFSSTFFLP